MSGIYNGAVGLSVSGKIFNDKAALLTGGQTHHELLLIEVGDAEGPLTGKRIGLYHIGWKIIGKGFMITSLFQTGLSIL